MTTPILETAVSFGMNAKEPDKLSTRTVGSMLVGVREGEWRDPVERVRSLPWDSLEQKAEKEKLPFWTPAGAFSRRENKSLLAHSGIYPIDLDALSERDTTKAIQRAITDRFCLAACRSCRGLGVRLLLRVPKCSAEEHSFLFDQVAAHVRSIYGHEPDGSGNDVCRASFVTLDNGLWIFAGADELPLIIPAVKRTSVTQRYIRCVTVSSSLHQSSEPIFTFLGREHAPYETKPDGIFAYTHLSLNKLAIAAAVELSRQHCDLDNDHLDEMIQVWSGTCLSKGLRLTKKTADYRVELRDSIEGARRKEWFHGLADKWIRWTRDPAFPKDPEDRIIFAIRKHCEAIRTPNFFLGCRDAARVAATDHVTAWRILGRLAKSGTIKIIHKYGKGRMATDYLLTSFAPQL